MKRKEELPALHCANCRKLLGKGYVEHLEIRCPRCNTDNVFMLAPLRAKSHSQNSRELRIA